MDFLFHLYQVYQMKFAKNDFWIAKMNSRNLNHFFQTSLVFVKCLGRLIKYNSFFLSYLHVYMSNMVFIIHFAKGCSDMMRCMVWHFRTSMYTNNMGYFGTIL